MKETEGGVRPLSFALCCALYRTIEPETHASIVRLALSCPGMVYRCRVGARLSDALEAFASEVAEPYVLFVDGDMVFTPQNVVDLFNALNQRPERGAVAGIYVKWSDPHLPLAHWRQNGAEGPWIDERERVERVGRYLKAGLVKSVDLFGGGFILCRRDVFDALEPPYFRSGEDGGGRYGQDTYFAKSLRAAGYDPSVHFGVQVGHIGPRCYKP